LKPVLIIRTEIILCYGSNTTKIALQAHFKRDINPNVKAICEARKQGSDAKDIIIVEGVRDGKPGKGQKFSILTSITHFPYVRVGLLQMNQILTTLAEILQYFGNTSTKSGIQQYVLRNITPNVKALVEARKKGEDPTAVILFENVRDGKPGKGQKMLNSLSSLHIFLFYYWLLQFGALKLVLISPTEIAKCYDSNMKRHTLYCHMWDKINPMVKAVSGARSRGDNPLDVPLTAALREGKPDKGQILRLLGAQHITRFPSSQNII
jgi:hypothetical protein